MASVIFLLGLYYLRFIPISIFWNIYSLFYRETKYNRSGFKNITFQTECLVIIMVSYVFAAIILVSLPIAIMNYFFQDNAKSLLAPMVLFTTSDFNNFLGKNIINWSFFHFLLNKWFCSRKKILVLKALMKTIKVLTLVSIIIGGIEVLNDYNSHLNPDIFDLLFPESGAGMFWGGIAILTLVYFFLEFILNNLSILRWKKRLLSIAEISPILRELVISPSLLHPYFFLSINGRSSIRKRKITDKKLSLLLEKAFIESKDCIPEEWLEE